MLTTTANLIAIDGPSGSGKGTVARRVAERLGWNLLDSGALYRLVGLNAHKRNVDPANHSLLSQIAAQLNVRFGMDADGNERWRHPMRWGMAANAFAIDLNGDGRRELVVGMDRLTMTSRLHTFAADGTLLPQQYTKVWQGESVRTPSWEQTGASVADFLSRNGGRPPLILVGQSGAFNQLSAYDAATEDHLWKREMGDRISGVVIADIDRDGGKDVAVATHAGWVVCYDATGNRRWACFLGSPVTALCRSSLRGSQLTAGTYGGGVHLVDQRGRRQRIRSGGAPITRLAPAYRGARVLCAAGDEVCLI